MGLDHDITEAYAHADPPSIDLPDYQQSGLQELAKVRKQGYKRVVLASPTGSGKGTLAVWMLIQTARKGNRALFVVHRREIIKDICDRLEAAGFHDFGVILAGDPR